MPAAAKAKLRRMRANDIDSLAQVIGVNLESSELEIEELTP